MEGPQSKSGEKNSGTLIAMENTSLFSRSEMDDRLRAVRAEMQALGVDALITMNQANIRYCTGFRGEPHTLLLTKAELVLFTSFRTLPWAEQQTQLLQPDLELSVASSPLEEIAKRLSNKGTRIGVDTTLSHSHFSNWSSKFTNHQLTPCSAIEQVRRLKSPAEIELLQQSQTINESIFEALLPQISPGMTERAVQGLMLTEMAQREEVAGYCFAPIVATGGNAWEIHHLPDNTKIQRDTLLLLDLGVFYQGYASDMTRTICLGKATEQMRDVYETVKQAQGAAISAMRPGASTREVDQAARKIITQAGHGRGFTHGLGHSIGLETHDPGLNLSPSTAEETLLPGMAFTVEPGIYLENQFGVRTEDVVIITDEEPVNITKQPKDFLELHF